MKRRSYIKPIKPWGRPVRRVSARDVANYLIAGVIMVVFAVCLAVLLIEWMAGCGETYIAADGKRYANECVFIPNPINLTTDTKE
jgi:hypothetical protein